MSLSQKALQKKREKKKKKRAVQLGKQSNSTVMTGNNWPLYECWMDSELWERGLGHVVVTRKNNQDDVAAGIFIIDALCLGVKDCFVRHFDHHDFRAFLEDVDESSGDLTQIEAVHANTLIQSAIEFAGQFGFRPHPDFKKAGKLLNNIAFDTTLKFPFGKDGKPCFIQGLNDSALDVRKIVQTLDTVCGPDNYDHICTSLRS